MFSRPKNLSASHRGGPPRPRPGVRVASPWRSTWWCWVPRASQGNWRVTLGITGRCMGMLGVNWNLEMLWNVARLTGLYWYMFIDVFSMLIGDKLAGYLAGVATTRRHDNDMARTEAFIWRCSLAYKTLFEKNWLYHQTCLIRKQRSMWILPEMKATGEIFCQQEFRDSRSKKRKNMSETHRDHKAQTLPPLPFLKRDRLMFHHCINLKKVYSNTSFAFSFIFWIRFAHDGLPCSIMFYQSVSVLAYASLSQVKRLVTRPIFSVCICCFQLDERAIKSGSLSIYIYAQ